MLPFRRPTRLVVIAALVTGPLTLHAIAASCEPWPGPDDGSLADDALERRVKRHDRDNEHAHGPVEHADDPDNVPHELHCEHDHDHDRWDNDDNAGLRRHD